MGHKTEHFYGRLVEREEMAEFRFPNAVGPGEAAFVVKVVIANRAGILDLPHPRQDDIVVVLVVLQKFDQLQSIIGYDIFYPHFAFDGLLGRADRPDGKVVDLS